ncbi:MAG: beta-glucosidase [Actinomycetales bacterium]|nr:beta-glucosidase [Actinomycetales bacterium]
MSGTLDVETLVGRLTLEEKASLCLGGDFWHTAAVERLGIPRIMMTDGPHGLRREPDDADDLALHRSLPATCFPTASALASSWDRDLVRTVGEALGREARSQGVAILLGPGVNIKRSPLCGRNFEYFSEDPMLSGELGGALVLGIQGQGVGASVKHYAVNNQETDRIRVSAEVDERALREIYLASFERVVTQARPWTVMCAYNRVNGTYASQNHWLLTEVLRNEWGFDGLVVSDWGAVVDRVAALAAGLDLEMPPNRGVSDALVTAAIRSGELDESVLDTAVARLLTVVDRAVSAAGADGDATADPETHHALARSVARDCAVLLKNDGGVLPLRPVPGETVAVIGEFARTPRFQGAGSSQVNPTRLDIALDELRALVPEGVTVTFAAGFGLDDDRRPPAPSPDGPAVPDEAAGQALLAEAVEVASRADHVVVFLGLPPSAESEGFDRRHLDLPPEQLALLRAVAEAHPRPVVVLANGSVVRVSGWERLAGALLETWLSGQAAGGAVADLLLGVASPSGRLAETIPLHLEDTPGFLTFPGEAGQVRYGEGLYVGYRGYDACRREVSYPFGHGLTYTTFGYDDLAVEVTGSHATGDLAVRLECTVTNTGDRAGREVVQAYVGDVAASVGRPVRELKAFTKVALDPGVSARVTFRLGSRDFSHWSVTAQDWVLEAGEFTLAVGASSRDLRLSTVVDLPAPAHRAPLEAESTLEEWLADPDGAAALREVFRDDRGAPAGLLADEELVALIGSFPMDRIASLFGTDLDRTALDALVRRVRAARAG